MGVGDAASTWTGARGQPWDQDRYRLRAWFAVQIAVEAERRTAFFLVPLGLILGIALFYGADMRPGWAVVLVGIPLALAVVLTPRMPSGLRALALLLACGLGGAGLAEWEVGRAQTTIFSGEATVRLEGRVVWREADERGRYRYVLDVLSTERPVLSRPPERVRIVVSSRHEPIPVGGIYEGLVRLRPPPGPAIPGAHDFVFTPFFSGLGAYGFSLGAPEAAARPASLDLAQRIAALRVEVTERIRTAIGGPEGAVAAALVTGARTAIPDEINEWLRITGLAHVLSISGFHMALVAGFAMLSIRAVIAAWPAMALRVPGKKIAAAAAFLVATGYLMIAGENVATLRSYIMLAIMLGAVMLDRPALTLRNVAIAGIIVMALNPHQVVTASFQMSFAATAALVGAYGAITRWWSARRAGDKRPRRDRGLLAGILLAIGGLALTAIIAGAATAIYGAYHFQRAATLGSLIANVAVMPLFSFWIMPLALVSVLVMPFGLDGPLLRLMGYGLTAVFEMARWLAERFPDHATGIISPLALVILTAALLAACFLASRLRWVCVPLAVAGLWLASSKAPPPELLVFEDGKQVALIDSEGRLHHLRERPNRFVADQWERAFPQERFAVLSGDTAAPSARPDPLFQPFACGEDGVCRAVTHSGLSIGWTEDYEKTGLLCDTTDIAIVARAIRLSQCRSGAHLVTLRTLRASGSLAFDGRLPSDGALRIRRAVPDEPHEWNLHRLASWPEYWRNPNAGNVDASDVDAGDRGDVANATTPAVAE
ncbi:ComEC/Rec2 family competence protein [Aureimonas mangrovi]|uniref:ComEC/Rec2 family competence protein n=1 Tax=Aureimonas mangrovi TaxID=2758041 RepID=UPI00163D57E4|nr:ComEC/Rec2 family competence protein [Aureimonas mangrovi]